MTETLRSLRRGYTREQLERTQRHAFGTISSSDIESYRDIQKGAIIGILFSPFPRGIASLTLIQTIDRALQALSSLAPEQLEQQMRSRAQTQLAKWGKA